MNTQPCPFCPLMLPDQPDLWERIGNDFFGEPAMIGDVHSCGSCTEVGEEHTQYWLDLLKGVASSSDPIATS